MPNFEQLLKQLDECTRLSHELRECVRRERQSLIDFKMEELLLANAEKEQLLSELTRARSQTREISAELARARGADAFEDGLTAEESAAWLARKNEWENQWEALRGQCVQNQDFYRHSLRNLDAIVENLKRVFGLHSTYTAKGTRSDSNPSGSVVEGSY